MKRAKQVLESYAKLAVDGCSGKQLNEKIEISPEQATSLKAAFAKAGFSVEVSSNTNGNVYIDNLYSCGGRYVNIDFDKGGFRLCVHNQGSFGGLLPHSEAIKMQAELKSYTDLLEKIKAINPELV